MYSHNGVMYRLMCLVIHRHIPVIPPSITSVSSVGLGHHPCHIPFVDMISTVGRRTNHLQ